MTTLTLLTGAHAWLARGQHVGWAGLHDTNPAALIAFFLFDKMTSHQMSSDQVLSMVVEQAIYPITTDVVYSLFAPFGVEQLVVYPQTKSEDGELCVAVDVRFTSAHAAAHAFAYWDGRCIYYRCCRLQTWCATLDVLPAPASPSPTVVKDNRDTVVDLNNSTTAISSHDGKSVGSVNIPAAASTSTPPHVHDTSPKSSLKRDYRVPVVGTDEYTLVAAIPEVVTELAVFPGVPSTTKAQEVLEVIHGAPPAYITMAHITCSTDGSNQVIATNSVNKVTTNLVKPAVDLNDNEVEQLAAVRPTHSISTGTFCITEEVVPSGASTTDIDSKDGVGELDASFLISINTSHLVTNKVSSIKLMQLFVDHDVDLPPTRHHGLRIRPMPWPSLWGDLADGREVRPIPWPFPVKKFMEHPFQFVQLLDMTSSTFPVESCHAGELVGNRNVHCIQISSIEPLCLWSLQQNNVGSCHRLLPLVTYAMQYLSHDLKSWRASLRYLPSARLKPCTYEKFACWIPMTPRDTPILSQPIMQLMGDLNLGVVVMMRCLVLLSSANIDYELRRRPDQTKDCGVLVKFRILHIFLVPSAKLQPWPSCRYTFTHFEQQFFPQLPFPRTDKMPDTRRHRNISVQWQCLHQEEFSGTGHCDTDGNSQPDGLYMVAGCYGAGHLVLYPCQPSHTDLVVVLTMAPHRFKNFYGLCSFSDSPTRELPEIDVYKAILCELMLVLDQHLDILNSRLDVSNNWCSLLWLNSDYMLNYDMDVIGSDWGIYLLDISWDPGGMAWPLLPELARRVVFEGERCVIILTAAYLVHASYISFRLLHGLRWVQGTTIFVGSGPCEPSKSYTSFGGAYLGHNYCFDLVEIYPGFGYHRDYDCFFELVQVHLNNGYYCDNYPGDPNMIDDLQAPWDPGELFRTTAWGQAAFQGGGDVRSPPNRCTYLGWPVDSMWAGLGCAHVEALLAINVFVHGIWCDGMMLEASAAQGYKAPELVKMRDATRESDVYSLGVVLLEMLAHKEPAGDEDRAPSARDIFLPASFKNLVLERKISDAISSDLVRQSRKSGNERKLNAFFELATACCSPSPSLRPNTKAILRRLEAIAK
uniref:Putative kinase-like protein TMKL1 n=1 Tax=Aegilops tauschii TaxID=37682 RepID=M8BLU4_AEGTA